jgi:hypothetical protein
LAAGIYGKLFKPIAELQSEHLTWQGFLFLW